jgi:pilus assembly protein CpaC
VSLLPGATGGARIASPLTRGEAVVLELNEGQLLRLDRPAASVFIANPAVADITVKSSRLIYLFGNGTGETTLYAVDEEDNVIANLRVAVEHNMSRLDDSLLRLIPAGGVSAVSFDGGIMLTGSVATAADSENARRLTQRFISEGQEVINQLDVTAPNQVNLRVRIAEVSKSVINEFGFNWDVAGSFGDFILGVATGNPLLAGTLFGAGTLSPAALDDNSFVTRSNSNNNLFVSATAGGVDINGLIDALAEDGLITVLAEPNLTALSGETASFLAGGEFPIPVPQEDGKITIEFKNFGVGLAFTPTVLDGNRISMRVRPEVSQLSTVGAVQLNGFFIPSLTTRRAETTVELASGQSFAIAGLLLNNTTQSNDSVPGLSDLPILGALFESDRFERNETELAIIVTPYVVRPVGAQRLALPTDPYTGEVPATPGQDFALSTTGAQIVPVEIGESAAGSQAATAGFIME